MHKTYLITRGPMHTVRTLSGACLKEYMNKYLARCTFFHVGIPTFFRHEPLEGPNHLHRAPVNNICFVTHERHVSQNNQSETGI